jgi:hypothetical protein
MSLDPNARMLIEWQCTQLVYRLAYLQDNNQIDDLAELYTDNAEIHSAVGVFVGRTAIRDIYTNSPPDFVVRHLITNVHFTQVAADRAEGIVYNTSFHALPGHGEENPFANARMMEFHDHYRLTEAGWKMERRASKMAFAPKDWIETTRNWIKGELK